MKSFLFALLLAPSALALPSFFKRQLVGGNREDCRVDLYRDAKVDGSLEDGQQGSTGGTNPLIHTESYNGILGESTDCINGFYNSDDKPGQTTAIYKPGFCACYFFKSSDCTGNSITVKPYESEITNVGKDWNDEIQSYKCDFL